MMLVVDREELILFSVKLYKIFVDKIARRQ